nr:WAS/WASL-interacting protein family member 1-like [Saimiri boliviensis boliviensis]
MQSCFGAPTSSVLGLGTVALWGGGSAAGGGAGARGLGATFLQTTLPHAESTEISGALEGIVSGRAEAGDHTGEPPPAPCPGRRRALPAPLLRTQGPHGASPQPLTFHREPVAPSPVLALRPHPGCQGLPHFPKPAGAPPPRSAAPPTHSLRPPPGEKMKPERPRRRAAGAGARSRGEGERTYFARRGAGRRRREIKARIRAA